MSPDLDLMDLEYLTTSSLTISVNYSYIYTHLEDNIIIKCCFLINKNNARKYVKNSKNS